jgi:hypothetical protein
VDATIYRNSNFVADIFSTGKSFSEALILASTKPQYHKMLFFELQVQYMKIASCPIGSTTAKV